MKNSYLLIDYGNTNIKAGIYDLKTKKVIEIHFIHKDESLDSLLNQFKKLNNYVIQKIFAVATINKDRLDKILKLLLKRFNVETKVICKDDFKGLLDFSNINKKVVIGNDLLLLGLYGSKLLTKSAIFCFGTVYTCVVMKKNKFESVLLTPNTSIGINKISKQTSIPNNLLPKLFNKTKGLNTSDCFASGANIMIEGYVDNVVKTYKLNSKNVLISGGDSYKYLNINKRYKIIDNLTLIALGNLVKEKCW